MNLDGRNMKVWDTEEWIRELTSDELPAKSRWSIRCRSLDEIEFGHGLWVNANSVSNVLHVEEGAAERECAFNSYELHPSTWLVPWSAILAISGEDVDAEEQDQKIDFAVMQRH